MTRRVIHAGEPLPAGSRVLLRLQLQLVYGAVDEHGQVIDVCLAPGGTPRPLAGSSTEPWHRTERYAKNRIEADHGQLTRRLRPMRGLTTDAGARTVIARHAFVQNLRRGHYKLTADLPPMLRVSTAFDELAQAV